ncbi:AraC family transcriptional regulator [Actinoplanes sp. LDG1-06]|uniref:AraC family transcriptional regulator n=1 Tax=Paractinoplanes ovalisporus TaxID=2810368 RepID=A0ABS2ACZ7_9ACTN|nr:helix-turn-helix domain-containing protein [Actinoplanes ovalisporus]MBM2617711.1 AraC family transcriptional regulator [Actinoplanes ovalisporus]
MLADVEVVSGLTDSATVVQIPDPATALAFRTTASGRSDLFVVGPRTRGRYHAGKGVPVCVRLRLRPGVARALFGIPIQALADRTVRITDLWGTDGAALTASLKAAAPDTARVLDLLQNAVGSRLGFPTEGAFPSRAPRPPDPFTPTATAQPVPTRADSQFSVPAGAALFGASAGAVGVGSPAGAIRVDSSPEVAAAEAWAPDDGLLAAAVRSLSGGSRRLADAAVDLGVSERHLRNVFAREIGLSPKHFARITRLRRVLEEAGTRQWSSLADDAGFFDQAHMISDFRAFMGVTPAAFTAGRLPPTTPCSELTRLTG